MVPLRQRQLFLRATVIAAAIGLVQLVPVSMAWSAPATRTDVLDGGGELSIPASHLALRWRGDPEATVELRWQADDEGWRAWQPVEHDLDMTTGQLVYSSLVTAERATRVQTRVTAGDAREVEVVGIDTRYGPRRLVRAPGAPSSGLSARASMADTRVPQPTVISRGQWGADESIRSADPPGFAPIRKLVVHHTDTSNGDPDPAATVRAIYTYHVQTRGWNDIGYNFLVDEQGRIYEGRWSRGYRSGETPTGEDAEGRGVIGAHAENHNTGSVGVSLLGSFTSQAPTAAAQDALKQLLAWKADRHGVDVLVSDPYTRVGDGTTVVFPNLAGHRDTKATSCPGDRLYDMLPVLRRRVADTVAAAHGLTKGYWVTTGEGHVHSFGEAGSFGSMAGQRLNAPVLGMAATVTQRGYWLLGADGGIFSFGDARFFGSTGAIRLNQPVVGMAATPSGNGYWLVARDGGIFSFGDARFFGSTGAIRLNSPIVGMAAASDGFGYWLVARDGGVFAFGVRYHGSIPGLRLPSYAGSVALRATAGNGGYYVLGGDGGVFTFGDARFHGARPLSPPRARDLALVQPSSETS